MRKPLSVEAHFYTRVFRALADMLEEGFSPTQQTIGFMLEQRSNRQRVGLGSHPDVRAWDRAVLADPELWIDEALYGSNESLREYAQQSGARLYEGPDGTLRADPVRNWWWWLDLIVDGRLPRPEIAGEAEGESAS